MSSVRFCPPLLTLTLLVSITYSQTSTAAEGQDVEALLERMERALNGPVPNTQKSGNAKKKKTLKVEDQVHSIQAAEVAGQDSPFGPLNAAPPEVRPITSPDVEKILEVDLNALKREEERPFPRTETYFLYETATLTPNFVLTKDDDSFRPVGELALKGVTLGMENRWRVYQRGLVQVQPTVHFDLAYKWGDGVALRQGIENRRSSYSYNLFQAALAAGMAVEIWKVRPYGLAGLSQSVLNQQGSGQSDTTTIFLTSEIAEAGLVFALTPLVEARAAYRASGLNLFFKEGLESQSFLVGASVGL